MQPQVTASQLHHLLLPLRCKGHGVGLSPPSEAPLLSRSHLSPQPLHICLEAGQLCKEASHTHQTGSDPVDYLVFLCVWKTTNLTFILKSLNGRWKLATAAHPDHDQLQDQHSRQSAAQAAHSGHRPPITQRDNQPQRNLRCGVEATILFRVTHPTMVLEHLNEREVVQLLEQIVPLFHLVLRPSTGCIG